jgi:lipoprotein-releasing system permease protein
VQFESFIALRYMRGKRKNRFVSLITIISVAGVSVGVIALIVVMSVMTGFDNALRASIIGNRAHLHIMLDTRHTIDDPETLTERIRQSSPEVIGAGPIIEAEALIQHGRYATGAFILGVDPEVETSVTDFAKNLTDAEGRTHGMGALPGEKEIVLGYRLAERMQARIGSEIAVMTLRTGPTPLGMRQGKPIYLTVSGISEARMSEFDQAYAFVDIGTAKMLTGKDGVDAIHVKLSDPFLADVAAEKIEQAGLSVDVKTWYESQAEFFSALKQEKLAMFIILVFIILVAAFNITSTLIMIVMEKRRDIGILRTLGASARSILLIFIVEGLLIGVGGTLLGVFLGTILAYYINPVAEFIAWVLGVDLFNSTVYYFDRIPVDVVPLDVTWVTLSAVALTFLSTLYPAWSASRLQPVDALRYE